MLCIEIKDPSTGWRYYGLAYPSTYVSVAYAISRGLHLPVRVVNITGVGVNIVDSYILYEITPQDLIDTTEKLRWQEVGF